MAIIKIKKLHEMNEKEINEQMRELKLELSKERAASEIGTVKSPGKIKTLRITIARILTIIAEHKNKKVIKNPVVKR